MIFKDLHGHKSRIRMGCLAGLFAMSLQLPGQDPYRQYLEQNQTASFQEGLERLSMFYDRKTLRKPLLDAITLRTETNRFDGHYQDYSARFEFENPRYNHFQNRINRLEAGYYRIQRNLVFGEILYTKYMAIIRHFELSQQEGWIRRQLELSNRIQDHYVKRLPHGGINVLESVYKSEQKSKELERSLSVCQSELRLLNQSLFGNPDIQVEPPELISIPSIRKIMDEGFTNHRILDSAYAIKRQISIEKYKQDRSDDNQWFEFIQLAYKNDPEDLLREKLSVGVSLKVPYLIPSRIAKDRSLVELLELNIKQAEYHYKKELQVKEILQDAGPLLADYEKLHDNIRYFSQKYDLDTLIHNGVNDPGVLLDIRLDELKAQYDLSRLVGKILYAYVDFLFYSDRLTEESDTYYLSWPWSRLNFNPSPFEQK
ncbi:MAG TPA: hypothetical protein VFX48_06415 [Saprospiraceae bacterium]|nr:hypothetical protein [Saprospiraceae bacterium]